MDPDAVTGPFDRGHLDAEPDVDSRCHRRHHRAVAVDREVSEQVTVVLDLVPQPLQGLMLGLVCGVGLDHGAQCLAGTPCTRRFERRRIDEGLRRLPGRRAVPEPCAQCFESVWEPLELQVEDVIDLVLGEPPTLCLVVAADRGQRVARLAGDSGLLCEGAERVADRVMDPRAAQVHGHPGQIDRVEPTPESVAGFEHDARDACPRQC